jgi:hypothetical protein
MARITDIINAASTLAGMDAAEITGPRRRQAYFAVRTAIAIIAREHGHSYPQIGRMMGRDHSSICHMIYQQDITAKKHPHLPALIEALRDECDGMPFGGWPEPAMPILLPVKVQPVKPEPVNVRRVLPRNDFSGCPDAIRDSLAVAARQRRMIAGAAA